MHYKQEENEIRETANFEMYLVKFIHRNIWDLRMGRWKVI